MEMMNVDTVFVILAAIIAFEALSFVYCYRTSRVASAHHDRMAVAVSKWSGAVDRWATLLWPLVAVAVYFLLSSG